MAISFLRWLTAGKKAGKTETVEIEQMVTAARELAARMMAYRACVDLIARVIGSCEFHTMRNGSPVREAEYYTLNFEPNANRSASAFWHEVIDKLCRENEALIVSITDRKGREQLVAADSWERPQHHPGRENEYRGVTAGEMSFRKTFRENEVIHLTLHAQNITPVLDAMAAAYERLLSAAQKYYTRSRGVRMKVKVSQLAGGEEDFAEKFKKLMDAQVKPFVDADSGVLPQFDGYDYTNFGDGGADGVKNDTREIRAMIDDVFDFTARGFGITPVLLTGNVADSKDAMQRTLTMCIDPLCKQIQQELTRKRYGYDAWNAGNYIAIDTTTLIHFDLFANAANVEKLIGSGAFSINDILAAAGRPRINAPWADKHYLTRNIGALEVAADHGGEEGNEDEEDVDTETGGR